jgi:hypothetical protein
MHLYPIESLRFKYGHHSAPSTAASPVEPLNFSRSLSRTDRGSAIALGVLLALILIAVGWYCNMQLKQFRERRYDHRVSRQLRTASGRRGAVCEINFGLRNRAVLASKPPRTRANSGMSTLLREKSASLWNSLWLDMRRSHLQSRTLPQHCSHDTLPQHCSHDALQAQEDYHRPISPRTLLPLSQPQQAQYPSREPRAERRASYYKHRSNVRTVETHASSCQTSLAWTRYDKWWWKGMASHRECTARVDRRFSTLAPILEPEAALQV